MHPHAQTAQARYIEGLPAVKRSTVLNACNTRHAVNSIAYSMSKRCGHQYRCDCSGQASDMYGIPSDAPGAYGGLSTVSMVTHGYFHEIPARDLKPGDAVGIMGEGTIGAVGHVRIFLGWAVPNAPSDSSYRAWEMSVGERGPDFSVRNDLAAVGLGRYRAYRYVRIEDDAEVPAKRFLYWRRGGPLLSGIDVTERQRQLIALGYDLGPYGPSGKGDDGYFGQRTHEAVWDFQVDAGILVDGIIGPQTVAALLAALAAQAGGFARAAALTVAVAPE